MELLFLGDSEGCSQSLGGEALMAEPKVWVWLWARLLSSFGHVGLCPGMGISLSYL